MNDLDEQLDLITSLLNQCARKLEGDLFDEQIEIYDLAFSRAELLAAKVIKGRAKNNAYLKDVSNYFCSEVVTNIAGRIARNQDLYEVDPVSLSDVTSRLPYLTSQHVKRLGSRFIKEGIPLERFDEEKSLIAKFGEGATKSGATLKGIFEKAIGKKEKKKK